MEHGIKLISENHETEHNPSAIEEKERIVKEAYTAIISYLKNHSHNTEAVSPRVSDHISTQVISKGSYDYFLDSISFKGTPDLHEAIHEILHFLSSAKRKGDEDPLLRVSKSGFHSLWEKDGEVFGDYFKLFNEGITDLLAENMYIEHTKNTSVKEQQYGYTPERRLVQTIVRVTAKHTRSQEEVVWHELVESFFKGNVFYLRKIASVVGDELFAELALLGVDVTKPKKELLYRNQEILEQHNYTDDALVHTVSLRQTQNEHTNELNRKIETLI